MKIFFTGGGTLGSVIPLVVIYQELVAHEKIISSDVLWIGGRKGPERDVVKSAGIQFQPIMTGKIRRYAHWRNGIDLVLIIVGFFQAIYRILLFRPRVIVNAGSYIGFPVLVAGWVMRVRCVILQLDVDPVRTNLLTAPFADRICVAFPESVRFFPAKKTLVTGIPVRPAAYVPSSDLLDESNLPLVYIIGGSTGSQTLNTLVRETVASLSSVARIIHITGKQKGQENIALKAHYPNYQPYEFVGDETLRYTAQADVVVSRAGAGMIAELSALKKPSILIPLPSSPQEHNAAYVQERGGALVLSEETCTPELFVDTIVQLLSDPARREQLSEHIARLFPADSAQRIAELITL